MFAGENFVFRTELFSFVVGKLDGRNPFSVDEDLGQFDDHVQRDDADIVGQVRTHAVTDPAKVPEMTLDIDAFVDVESIAKDEALRQRVDAEFFIMSESLLSESDRVAGVVSQAVEQSGIFRVEDIEEVLGRKRIGEGDAEIALVNVDPVFEGHLVGLSVSVDGRVDHEHLMRDRAEAFDVILLRKVNVARSEETFSAALE